MAVDPFSSEQVMSFRTQPSKLRLLHSSRYELETQEIGKAPNKTNPGKKKIAEELESERKRGSTLLSSGHVIYPEFLSDFFVCKWNCSYDKEDLRSTGFKEWVWVLKG